MPQLEVRSSDTLFPNRSLCSKDGPLLPLSWGCDMLDVVRLFRDVNECGL